MLTVRFGFFRIESSLICYILLALILPLTAQQTIVIAPFQPSAETSDTDRPSLQIADHIQDILVRSASITVLEREKLQVILDEQKLAQSGLIKENEAVEAGQLIGADYVLLGSLDILKNKRFHVSLRMIDIESGKVIKQWTATEIPEKKIGEFEVTVAEEIVDMARQNTALSNIVCLTNSTPAFRVQLKANSEHLVFGEMLELVAKTDSAAYLYIFDIGTSGDIHLLFPNRIQSDNYIQAGDSVRIGPLRAGPPEGVEIVKAIATRDSISLREMMDIAGTQATFQAYDAGAEAFSRDLELFVSPLPEARWSSAVVRLNINKK